MKGVNVANWSGVVVLSIALIGCGNDATEPNETNFAAAVNAALENEGAFCVPMQFPVGAQQR